MSRSCSKAVAAILTLAAAACVVTAADPATQPVAAQPAEPRLEWTTIERRYNHEGVNQGSLYWVRMAKLPTGGRLIKSEVYAVTGPDDRLTSRNMRHHSVAVSPEN